MSVETKLTIQTQEVVISPSSPFVIIGERINPTRRKKYVEALEQGDFSLVKEDALKQVEAGAQVLDVNAGVPNLDEPALLKQAVAAVMEVTSVPLCLDSANPAAIEAALSIYPGKALINSTTAEERMLDPVLSLARQFDARLIGVISDEQGIPATPEERLGVAEKLLNRAAVYGVPVENILIDCLALSVGSDQKAGRVTLDAIRLISEKLGSNLVLGASNVSFGLPDRKVINATYLALAISRGLTAAITDPTVEEISVTLLASDLLMGRDEFARQWLKSFRKRERMKKESA